MDGVAARHEPTARVGAGAPVELPGVAGDHGDLTRIAAERVSGDLGEGGVVSLARGGQSRRYQHAAARLHSHMRALVRANARAFDVAPDPDAEVPSLGSGLRLARAERREVRSLEGHLQSGGGVAAVVARRPAVLEREADVPRELVGLDEVAPAHLGVLETERLGDEAEHALHHERAVRAAGTA